MAPPRPGAAVDLSAALDALARDLCPRVPQLAHVDPDRILFTLARSRAAGPGGVYARIVPLRFEAGRRVTTRRRGRWSETWRLPTLSYEGREIRYIITVMVPRFLRLSCAEKLNTVVHELYHVSEACDGDIRRFPGRNFAHGASRAAYNRIVTQLAEAYLSAGPDPALLTPLRLDEAAWQDGAVRLTGLRVPLPRAKLVARERT